MVMRLLVSEFSRYSIQSRVSTDLFVVFGKNLKMHIDHQSNQINQNQKKNKEKKLRKDRKNVWRSSSSNAYVRHRIRSRINCDLTA